MYVSCSCSWSSTTQTHVEKLTMGKWQRAHLLFLTLGLRWTEMLSIREGVREIFLRIVACSLVFRIPGIQKGRVRGTTDKSREKLDCTCLVRFGLPLGIPGIPGIFPLFYMAIRPIHPSFRDRPLAALYNASMNHPDFPDLGSMA